MTRIQALFVLLCMPAALASQNPPQSPPIHVTTHLVQIGVIVRDRNGPVASLTKNDFTIYDRGKQQPISVFTIEPASTAPPVVSQPLPPNTFSDLPQENTLPVRSITIVLLDNINTLAGNGHEGYESGPSWMEDLALANAKAHLIAFIKTMDPRDRVAVYGLSDTLHVLSDFTNDRDRLLAILNRYDTTSRTNRDEVEPGAQHTPGPGADFDANLNVAALQAASLENQRRSALTMAALRAIAAHVSNIPGRKNLVWLTSNLPFSGTALAQVLSPAQIAAYPVDGRGLLSRAPIETLEGVMDEDAAARGNFMPAQAPQPIGLDTMQKLAEETGGHAFINTNDLTGAIRDAVEDSAVSYTLGFYVDSNSLDGKFHELKVQLNRPGLTLRYPRGYFALKDVPASKDERHNNFLVAIQSPLESAVIPLQLRIARVSQPSPNSLSLAGSVGIAGLHFTQKGGVRIGTIDISVLQQDQTGKVLNESANRINLRFTDKEFPIVLKSGISFEKHVQAVSAATTLRVLVQDPVTAAIGSLIIPLSEVK